MASAIHGVAFLIEEMEENMTNETVRDIINSQLTELMLDIRSVKEKIDDHLQRHETEASTNPIDTSTQTSSRPQTYANALISPLPYADLKLAAREGI